MPTRHAMPMTPENGAPRALRLISMARKASFHACTTTLRRFRRLPRCSPSAFYSKMSSAPPHASSRMTSRRHEDYFCDGQAAFDIFTSSRDILADYTASTPCRSALLLPPRAAEDAARHHYGLYARLLMTKPHARFLLTIALYR